MSYGITAEHQALCWRQWIQQERWYAIHGKPPVQNTPEQEAAYWRQQEAAAAFFATFNSPA